VTSILDMQMLRSIPLFDGLNETEYRQIAEVVQIEAFQGGEVLLRQERLREICG
jgi:signal-transduction protein with cAMP-binding, CBS, and nucleotidyltransferase domain